MFLKNIVSESAASVVGALAVLAMQIVFARVLPVQVFASFLLASAIIGVSEVLADFGLRIAGMRDFAVQQHASKLFSAITTSKLAIAVVLAAVALAWPVDTLGLQSLLVIVGIAVTQFSTDPFIWYFRGRERMDVSAGLIVTWRLINTSTLITAALTGATVDGLLMVWLANNILRIVLGWAIVRRHFDPELHLSLTPEIVREALALSRAAFPIGVAFVSVALYNRLGVLLLSRFGTDLDVAVYGVAFTLVASSAFIATAITNASFPRIARAISSKEWVLAVQHLNHNTRLIAQVFMPLCLGGIVLATWAVQLLYPPRMNEAANAIILLLPGLFLSNINLALKFFMNAAGENWAELFSVLLGVSVFSGFLVMGVGPTLFESAAIAWGLSEVSIFLAKLFFLSQNRRISGIRWGIHISGFLALVAASFVRLYVYS